MSESEHAACVRTPICVIEIRKMPNIIVEEGAWGTSRLEDVHAVASSVCSVLQSDAAVDVPRPIIVRFCEQFGPRALMQRGKGNEHIILVSASNCCWAQLAFQFAHEYCHVFSNHTAVPFENSFRWLEESFCETASLYVLLRLGDLWQSYPPYPNWSSYAGSLTAYANDRINSTRWFATAADFREWLDSCIDRMKADSVIRELNNVVAVQVLPYFQQFPEAWQAVTQMNTKPNLSGDLDDYFAAWRNSCGPAHYVAGIAKRMHVQLQNPE